MIDLEDIRKRLNETSWEIENSPPYHFTVDEMRRMVADAVRLADEVERASYRFLVRQQVDDGREFVIFETPERLFAGELIVGTGEWTQREAPSDSEGG